MAYPTTDWPTSVDAARVVVTDDWIYPDDYNYQDGQIRALQTWLGEDGDLIGDGGTSTQGPGGLASPVADGGTAIRLAAKADYTSGNLVSIGDKLDTGYVEHASIDFEGKAVFAGVQLGATTAVTSILDEDTMTSDSAVALATQQSIKAYVDAAVAVENLWNRSGTILSPNTSGDTIDIEGISVGGYRVASTECATPGTDPGDLRLYHTDPAGQGGNADVAHVTFMGLDDAGTPAEVEYARITGGSISDAAGAETGKIKFNLSVAGSLATRWTMEAGRFYGNTGGAYMRCVAGSAATPEHTWLGSETYGMTLVSSEILHSIAGTKATGVEVASNIPYLNLYRMDTHGTNIVGAFTFTGKDAAGTEAEYAQVMGYADSATGGSEVGSLVIKTATSASGALTTCATISAEGTEFDPGTRHKRQAVTSSSNQVNVDCENGYVVYHQLTENTTIQAPTNEVEPAELIFLIDGDGSSTISFQTATTAGAFWIESSMPSLGASDRLTIKFIYDTSEDAWIESSRTDVFMGSA